MNGQILLDVPAADYQRRELGTATSGVLQRLRTQTPAHIKAWAAANDDGDTPAKVFGKAYHCRVLEPEVFAATYCAPPPEDAPRDLRHLRKAKNPSDATRESIAFWDAWEAEHKGQIMLPRDAFEQIEEMYAALLAHPVAAGILKDGVSEVTMRWTDEASGVPCKARADWWVQARSLLVDLKTTDEASPEAFARTVDRYGYHVQHAHYCAGAQACGMPAQHYLILAQEKDPPYLPAVYSIDAAAEVRGFELRERGLEILRRCRESNIWPGYAGITEISLPAWALKD